MPRLVSRASTGRFTVTKLCPEFGASRNTSPKRQRIRAGGFVGVRPRRRAGSKDRGALPATN